MKFQAKTKKWKFAVFKYSNEKYDPDEWMFPGAVLLDGIIEGAMKAGLEIYPDTESKLEFGFSPKGGLLLLIFGPILLVVSLVRKLFRFLLGRK